MSDNMCNSAAEENVNILLEDLLNNLAKLQLDRTLLKKEN
jgi:hypothetical protein